MLVPLPSALLFRRAFALAETQNASEETGNRARYERSVGGFATVNRPCAASPYSFEVTAAIAQNPE
jgi:hypothetical protein